MISTLKIHHTSDWMTKNICNMCNIIQITKQWCGKKFHPCHLYSRPDMYSTASWSVCGSTCFEFHWKMNSKTEIISGWPHTCHHKWLCEFALRCFGWQYRRSVKKSLERIAASPVSNQLTLMDWWLPNTSGIAASTFQFVVCKGLVYCGFQWLKFLTKDLVFCRG